MLWLAAILVLLSNKGGDANLVVRPQNAVSIEDIPVTVHCSTAPNDSCHWSAASSLHAVGKTHEVPLTIYNGDEAKLDASQYFVNKSLPGQCDLVILKPRISSRLVYACSANNGFGEPSYASVAVLKSNLMCADNVKPGTTGFDGRTIRNSIHLLYAGDMALSVYLERSDGSVENVCGDAKAKKDSGISQLGSLPIAYPDPDLDGSLWRLECDYAVTTNGSYTFFAAVSDVINVERIDVDRNVPTERFYCSNNGWLKVHDDLELSPASTDNVSNTEPKNVTAITAGSIDAATSANRSLISLSFNVPCCILSFVLVLCFAIVLFCCYCRLKRRQIPKENTNEAWV